MEHLDESLFAYQTFWMKIKLKKHSSKRCCLTWQRLRELLLQLWFGTVNSYFQNICRSAPTQGRGISDGNHPCAHFRTFPKIRDIAVALF